MFGNEEVNDDRCLLCPAGASEAVGSFSDRAGASTGETMRDEMVRLQREGETVKRMRMNPDDEQESSGVPVDPEAPQAEPGGFVDEDGAEARKPRGMRDPGAPTQEQIEEHNINHLPYRSWCPACVAGKAKDRMHFKIKEENHEVPTIVFDYCFLATNDAKTTIPIQVMLDTRTQMIFGHVVPRKGMMDAHGCNEMCNDLEKLGYSEIILKCDEEPALINIQNTVAARRQRKTVCENSPVGDSQSNGKAERAVQTLSGQVRVLKKGLEDRCKMTFSSEHPIEPWLVEHAADVLSRFHVGRDGHTAYERWKGKKFRGEDIEFGEIVHYKHSKREKNKKLEMRWDEGVYLGRNCRTGEAYVALEDGVKKAGTVQRVGGHRRWDGERLSKIVCLPWKIKPEPRDPDPEGMAHPQTEEEKSAEVEARQKHEPHLRMKLLRDDFFEHGFTEGCKGCRAIINKAAAQAHTERCRQRVEKLIIESDNGASRKRKAVERENEWIASKMEVTHQSEGGKDRAAAAAASNDERNFCGRAAPCEPGPVFEESSVDPNARSSGDTQSSAALAEHGQKRSQEPKGDYLVKWHHGGKRSKPSIQNGVKRRNTEEPNDSSDKRYKDDDEELLCFENSDGLQEMNLVEMWKPLNRVYTFDPSEWEPLELERNDMCLPEQFGKIDYDQVYYDETSWDVLDSKLVIEAEEEEMKRFRNHGVYEYKTREEAQWDPLGVSVKVKWVRINKGTAENPNVRCRLVAQEIAYGERDDDLYAGTPSLASLEWLISDLAPSRKPDSRLMVLNIKSAFL